MRNRQREKKTVRALSADGLTLGQISRRAEIPKSTVARWLREDSSGTPTPVPTSEPSPDAGTDPRPDAVDLNDVEFLQKERARLYDVLSMGYDRSAALLYTSVSKELRELKTCEFHFEVEDARRLCASLNALWLRHLARIHRGRAFG